ncbi:MAG: hypothetical protein AB1446_10435 [Bacillota bacterium]
MSGRGSRCAALVRRHRRSLLSRPEVVGVGVGKDAGGEDCLVVIVDANPPVRARRFLPRRIWGVPTVVMEAGVIKTLSGPQSE